MNKNGANGTATLPALAKVSGATLEQVLEKHRGEHHVIVIQDYPDPDAIASAFVHRLISQRFDIVSDIIYGGRISHQQNVALVKLLGNPLVQAADEPDLGIYDGSVFVDGQGGNSILTPKLAAAGVPVVAIIDHHTRQEQLPAAEFIDLRHLGATATIYTEYIQDGLLDLDRSRREHVLAATALMHGLMTDTNQFIHATERDFNAAAFLGRYFDAASLTEVMRQARSRQTMDIIRLALQNRVLRESYSLAGIGYVRAVDRDAIPQAADFMLTEENVHTAIVYGIVIGERDGQRTESVIGSLRTTKLSLDPDQFIKEVFGRDERGQFYGGGRNGAGGFEIPIGLLVGGQSPEYEALKWQLYDMQIKQRLFAKIGIKE